MLCAFVWQTNVIKTLLVEAMNHLTAYRNTTLHVLTAPWHTLYCSAQSVLNSPGKHLQRKHMRAWSDAKKKELTHVSFAGSLVASVVTGSLQWASLNDTHWIVQASWYGSLVMSIFCVIIAFHLCLFVTTYETDEWGKENLLGMLRGHDPKEPRFLSLYVLQVPTMLFSYATISYAGGLSILVLYPLWSSDWSAKSKIALVFAAYLVFSCLSFLVVAYAMHHVYIPQLRMRNRPASPQVRLPNSTVDFYEV
ncbi:hypothetical protein T440DRAFT_71740 [Plenodomus tracheiphilus IPT5]|uniref:Uncharacterized protein n=1 Tax=Plenodomus tracheiphilus IPT5 TaxID=1408161 RepID=A0A6A7B7I5_9PLEO|nr:hypothetical protein T440DRAFT_71740 [Plenodomus tracheiphilus IPT5]